MRATKMQITIASDDTGLFERLLVELTDLLADIDDGSTNFSEMATLVLLGLAERTAMDGRAGVVRELRKEAPALAQMILAANIGSGRLDA